MNDSENTKPWERVDPPLYWPQIGKYIVADRHLPDGTRQHMVRGHVESGCVVNNAQILGEDDCSSARYSTKKIHSDAYDPGNSVPQVDEAWVMRNALAQRHAKTTTDKY